MSGCTPKVSADPCCDDCGVLSLGEQLPWLARALGVTASEQAWKPWAASAAQDAQNDKEMAQGIVERLPWLSLSLGVTASKQAWKPWASSASQDVQNDKEMAQSIVERLPWLGPALGVTASKQAWKPWASSASQDVQNDKEMAQGIVERLPWLGLSLGVTASKQAWKPWASSASQDVQNDEEMAQGIVEKLPWLGPALGVTASKQAWKPWASSASQDAQNDEEMAQSIVERLPWLGPTLGVTASKQAWKPWASSASQDVQNDEEMAQSIVERLPWLGPALGVATTKEAWTPWAQNTTEKGDIKDSAQRPSRPYINIGPQVQFRPTGDLPPTPFDSLGPNQAAPWQINQGPEKQVDIIDIYLTAGPTTSEDPNTSACEDLKCCLEKVSSYACSLYRVTLRLNPGLPPDLVGIVNLRDPQTRLRDSTIESRHYGLAQPTVSPSGEKIAWIEEFENEEKQLWIASLYTQRNRLSERLCGEDSAICSKVMTEDKADLEDDENYSLINFPAWWHEYGIFVSHGTEGSKRVDMVFIDANGNQTANILPLLGKDALYEQKYVFQDVDVAKDGTYRLATFGGPLFEPSDKNPLLIPRVNDVFGNNTEHFIMGPRALDPDKLVKSCQHPSWGPDGKEIVCSEQQESERTEQTNPRRLSDVEIKLLYSFKPFTGYNPWFKSTSTVWLQRGEALGIIDDGKITIPDFFLDPWRFQARATDPITNKEIIPVLVFKLSNFCKLQSNPTNNDLILATVFSGVQDESNQGTNTDFSRVFLYDRQNRWYLDLISLLEEHMFELPTGSLSGVYSTCVGR